MPFLTLSIMDLRSRNLVIRHSSSDTSFPIIAIAVIGVLATAFLLVGYYIFVIKCCLNWHRIDLLRRFSLSRSDDPLTAAEPRGLDEAVIRSIPIFRFKKATDDRDSCECAVCLNEFEEDEKLRSIPGCSHVFHIDCIDVWLQSNANCPLCRSSISLQRTGEDFVVIELVKEDSTSMGDECMDLRGNQDEQIQVQPIRRSSTDRQLFVAVEDIVSQQNRQGSEVSPMEGCSTS